jgi:DNA-binding transcriptional MocR family regulator
LQRDAGARRSTARSPPRSGATDDKQLAAALPRSAIWLDPEGEYDTAALAYEELASAGMVESTVGRGHVRANASRMAPRRDFHPELADRESCSSWNGRARFGSAGEAVPMHSLVPDPSLYPAEAFRRVLNRVLTEGGAPLFQYGGTQGHPRMLEVMAAHLRKAGIEIDAEGIILCHGASQGISALCRGPA